MVYYSLQGGTSSKPYSFKEATLLGQSPDGGLFFPSEIPQWSPSFLASIKQRPIVELGVDILKPYVGDDIDHDTLYQILHQTLSFDIPIRHIHAGIHTLELFHGPTMAFKDVGAGFLSRTLAHFAKDIAREVVVLVATSGDTGGAVSAAFDKVDGVKVVILYPSGKVSPLQEKQLCSTSPNVYTLEIKGTFDDCQQLVKQAFRDQALHEQLYLTSANSINISRWLPQQLYYVHAFQQWHNELLPPLCVPSGNLGNLCAGVLAFCSGLPVQHFIAACNANDAISSYLQSKTTFQPKTAVPTLSNAMDIGAPNNFIRLWELFQKNDTHLKQHISGYAVSDETTLATIRRVYEQAHYLLDPHGAVGYHALETYLRNSGAQEGIFLETAHPVKFAATVETAIRQPLSFESEKINALLAKPKTSILLEKDFASFRSWLVDSLK